MSIILEITKDFQQNDWRQVVIQVNKMPKSGYTQKYQPVVEYIKNVYPDYDPKEASYLIRTGTLKRPNCPECGTSISFRNDPTPGYPKFCTMSCRSKHSNQAAEPIIIAGIRYSTIESAISSTGLDRMTIRSRVFDPIFPEYKWDCQDHDAKCIEKLSKASPILTDKATLDRWKSSGDSQGTFCVGNGISADQLRYALTYFGIDSSFDQISSDAREFLDDKDRFVAEFSSYSMERLAVIYNVSPGTIKNYARKYGLNTSTWSNGVSKAETELYLFIKEFFPDAEQSYRKVFGQNGLELDVYIPSKHIGIEFNGIYTHSDKIKDKAYHRNKHLAFREQGYRYIQVWEDDWTYRNDKVKRFLKNALGLNIGRIGARKTTYREITQEEFDTFMNANHMQGTTKSKYRLGLFCDGDLVSAMGFREIASNVREMYHTGKGIDLVRFANTNVTGAFTKLLSTFLKLHQYNYILSYADLEIVSPFKNVYSSNGFSVVKEIKEDYRYYNGKSKIREHKFNWRKDAFAKLGMDITGKTEFQLADDRGMLRCYDSGKILYIKVVSDEIISSDITVLEFD